MEYIARLFDDRNIELLEGCFDHQFSLCIDTALPSLDKVTKQTLQNSLTQRIVQLPNDTGFVRVSPLTALLMPTCAEEAVAYQSIRDELGLRLWEDQDRFIWNAFAKFHSKLSLMNICTLRNLLGDPFDDMCENEVLAYILLKSFKDTGCDTWTWTKLALLGEHEFELVDLMQFSTDEIHKFMLSLIDQIFYDCLQTD